MAYETWPMGDGNSVAYTEDYVTYRKALSVSGVEWFGTYMKGGLDFAWQVIFPTHLKRRLTNRIRAKRTPKQPQELPLSKMNMGSAARGVAEQ